MKKSLALVLILVLSFSVMVAAEEHDLPNQPLGNNAFSVFDDGKPKTNIDATINVKPYLYVDEWNIDPMVFNLDSPAAMGNAYNIIRPFTFATNTTVKVTLTEDFTGLFKATDALHTAVLLQDFTDASGYHITGQPGKNHANAVYTFAPGKHSGKLNVGIGWYNTNETTQAAGSWDELPWWDVLAGKYEGQITMTVENIGK